MTGRQETRTWPATLAFQIYGLSLGLRANRPDLLDALQTIVPPGAQPIPPYCVDRWYSVVYAVKDGGAAPDELSWRVEDDEGVVEAGPHVAEAVAVADTRLRLHIATFAHDRVFVHAGVVCVGGRAIVLPGRSFTGKSTLVASLLSAGASYVSDEYAVLDTRGYVHPYTRPLSLRSPGSRRGTLRDPRSLGAAVAGDPMPVALVVLTRFQPGVKVALNPITPGQVVLVLLDNTLPAQHAPERVWPTLRATAELARGFRGDRGEADEAATAVLSLLR